jgi:hypothetical protein
MFCFPLFGPFLLSNLITFLFIIHFEWFNMLQEHHLKFYKSPRTLIATYNEFFECLETNLCNIQSFIFWILTPFYFGGS